MFNQPFHRTSALIALPCVKASSLTAVFGVAAAFDVCCSYARRPLGAFMFLDHLCFR